MHERTSASIMRMVGSAARWGARLVGGLASLAWAFVLVAGALSGSEMDGEDALSETIGVVVFSAANIAAYVYCWFRERRGALVLLATAACFGAFALGSAGRQHWLAVLVSAGPFLTAAVGFLWASRAPSAP